MKLQTVNVVEYVDERILSIHSFTDDTEGNSEAEKCFREKAIENGIEESDLDSDIDDGWSENGTYAIYLVHS